MLTKFYCLYTKEVYSALGDLFSEKTFKMMPIYIFSGSMKFSLLLRFGKFFFVLLVFIPFFFLSSFSSSRAFIFTSFSSFTNNSRFFLAGISRKLLGKEREGNTKNVYRNIKSYHFLLSFVLGLLFVIQMEHIRGKGKSIYSENKKQRTIFGKLFSFPFFHSCFLLSLRFNHHECISLYSRLLQAHTLFPHFN